MSEDGQRGPGSGGTAHRGRPGARQARQNAGGESPSGDGQDHAGPLRPDALIPAPDEGQLAALREIGREWDRVYADPQVWRQALPVDPSLGEYLEASEVRPALFTPGSRRVLHRRERGTRLRPRRGRPLVNYLWTLHEQRPDLTLTVAVPELVDRHWWHRILHEHVAERLQPMLQSLPRVVVTSVPFHLVD
jgi:hypothetical protein